MKKIFNLLLAGVFAITFAACEQKEPVEDDTDNPSNNTSNLPKFEFPAVAEFPIECGNLIAEGSEVGVTIEITKVEDQNFVFELRPGPLVQSFKLDVYPISQLYNNLLNDKNAGSLEEAEAWAVNERIREYLFNESGSGGDAFSVNDQMFANPEDFLQIEFNWMSTPYAPASAIAIPDCGYVIAVVGSSDPDISSANQEELTLCYVHTTSQPLVGDPQVEIDVTTGYTAFAVNHILSADAAAVYFFGGLQAEIDQYIDAFGDTMMRDFVRTLVSAPSVADDPNNPESLRYSMTYGDEADPTVMSTTLAVAVDANLTPQEDYARVDFHLKEVAEEDKDLVAVVNVDILEDRVASSYAECNITFSEDCQTIFYNIYPASFVDEYNGMTDKEKRNFARELKNQGYLAHNPTWDWDTSIGYEASTKISVVNYVQYRGMPNSGFVPGDTYVVMYVGRDKTQKLTEPYISEEFTPDVRNLDSPDACTVENLSLVATDAKRTQFRGIVSYKPGTVSRVYIQYMTADNNPGLDENSSWKDWMNFIFSPSMSGTGSIESSNILVNVWDPIEGNGDLVYDGLAWAGMEPDTEYTLYMCAEDFDGNVSQMHFAKVKTLPVQVGPDPTIIMELQPAERSPYDWTVSYTIDHDVEYFLYCITDNVADLSAHMPGINKGHLNNIKDSGYTYEQWYDGIYEWVAGGFENNGGGMNTNSDTTQDWEGDQTVIAACIAVGRADNGDPVYKMYHLICKGGEAQTLEQIFGIE